MFEQKKSNCNVISFDFSTSTERSRRIPLSSVAINFRITDQSVARFTEEHYYRAGYFCNLK